MLATNTQSATAAHATLAVNSLSHQYGNVIALRDVTAQAVPGRITALLGPNAAGKSTLLRCIIGALKPTSGCAVVDGKPTHTLSPYQLAQRVAYVPQRSTVAAAFSVREVVELGRYVLPRNRHRIEAAMDQMELSELSERPYAELSVGQQQRVTLARALAQLPDTTTPGIRPGHLILDEPMSAMDLRHVQAVVSLLRDLAQRQVTVLIAMHDLTLAAAIADDVWLLDEGRMVSGPACDILTIDRLREVYCVEFAWVQGRLLTVHD